MVWQSGVFIYHEIGWHQVRNEQKLTMEGGRADRVLIYGAFFGTRH